MASRISEMRADRPWRCRLPLASRPADQSGRDLAAETGLELSAVLPTFMQGPMLGAPRAGTTEVVRRLLAGQVPAVPNVGWNVVDVRDIAELHILAMTSPAAAGQRFLGSAASSGTATSPACCARGFPTRPGKSARGPCPTSPSSCSHGGAHRWRCCATNSAAKGLSTAAKRDAARLAAPSHRADDHRHRHRARGQERAQPVTAATASTAAGKPGRKRSRQHPAPQPERSSRPRRATADRPLMVVNRPAELSARSAQIGYARGLDPGHGHIKKRKGLSRRSFPLSQA